MEPDLFDAAGQAWRSLVPAALGPLHQRRLRYGLKVWFGPAKAPRAHYEAQVVGARHVAGAEVLAIEVGFHAEHPRVEDNDAVVAALLAGESGWREVLGPEPVAGPFLGRPDDWRRVSETWADPDLADPELVVEVATRLADYVAAFEPLLRGT